MTVEGILKEEEITLTYTTWTFDPSVLWQDADDEEGLLRFPEEVEDVFNAEGYSIFAVKMEVFESTEIDGKTAFVSVGIQPVALIADSETDDYDGIFGEVEYDAVIPGGKVLFAPDDYMMFYNEKEYMLRSVN